MFIKSAAYQRIADSSGRGQTWSTGRSRSPRCRSTCWSRARCSKRVLVARVAGRSRRSTSPASFRGCSSAPPGPATQRRSRYAEGESGGRGRASLALASRGSSISNLWSCPHAGQVKGLSMRIVASQSSSGVSNRGGISCPVFGHVSTFERIEPIVFSPRKLLLGRDGRTLPSSVVGFGGAPPPQHPPARLVVPRGTAQPVPGAQVRKPSPAVSAERGKTLGPAAQLPLRAPKAPDPHAVQVLKRPNERKLAGWANDPAGHAPGAFVTAGRCG